MPKRPDFILQISIRNIEDFSPETIAGAPRTFRPMDVRNACANLRLTPSKESPPPLAMAVSSYVALDFFELAHATGLYNRQIKLWEGLARITNIEFFQASKGIFAQEKLPEFDIAFIDHKMRKTALVHFALPKTSGENFDYLKSCREFLKRASLFPGISGVFLCYPSPFPAKVLEYIKKETNATGGVARFESILPKLGVPINLLEIDTAPVYDPGAKSEIQKIRLIHPDLGKKKLGSAPMPGADLSSMDRNDELSSEADFH